MEPAEGLRDVRQLDHTRAIVQGSELKHHRHLTDDILAFWIKQAPHGANGGFHGELDRRGRPVASRPKSRVQPARFLWSFLCACRLDPRPVYRKMADRALSFLLEHFHDPRSLGWFWLVAPDRHPLVRQKHLYGQAIAIHCLSQIALAFGDREALRLARDTFGTVDHRGCDSEHRGYRQSFHSQHLEDSLPHRPGLYGAGTQMQANG